jgi:hypothetical protein
MSNKKSDNLAVKILMERDGYSLEEAIAEVENLATEIFDEMGDALSEEIPDFDWAEEFIMDNLGLEPDYIVEVLAILDQE